MPRSFGSPAAFAAALAVIVAAAAPAKASERWDSPRDHRRFSHGCDVDRFDRYSAPTDRDAPFRRGSGCGSYYRFGARPYVRYRRVFCPPPPCGFYAIGPQCEEVRVRRVYVMREREYHREYYPEERRERTLERAEERLEKPEAQAPAPEQAPPAPAAPPAASPKRYQSKTSGSRVQKRRPAY